MTDLPKEAVSVVLPSEDNENEFIEIEATGSQFLWYLRYPGRDGKIGKKYFTQINSKNPVGQTWTDDANLDDFMTNEIVLPVGKKVRVRVTARDVLHNFYIKDMRVKMDAVPGMPTYFIFTPTVTTDSMRRRLSERPEWQVADKNDDTKQRWETFNYELACAELCGRGHYSMRNLVKIVDEEEYLAWVDSKEGGEIEEVVDTVKGTTTYALKANSIKSQYFDNVYGKEGDPQEGNVKISNMQTLVTNKLLVKKTWDAAKTIRNGSEYGTDAYKTAAATMEMIQTNLNTARHTNNIEESNQLLNSSMKALADLVATQKVEEPAPSEPAIDTTTVEDPG
jgi:cytochrome c oxidase subunit 2